MIYIASPYSSPIPEAHRLRFEKVRAFTVHCLREGLTAFSPIVYAHEIALGSSLPTTAAYWMRFNNDILRHAEGMFVYMIHGWAESKGVTMERNLAKALGIPIAYYNEDFTVNLELTASEGVA